MNEIYRDLVLSRVRAAIDASEAVRKVTHQGLKGQLREILIRDLFRPLYPTDIGVGTGQIITSNNEQSPQLDVVLYDKRILPPILLEGNLGMFPIESVLYTIEIKSILTATELRITHDSAKKIWDMYYLSPLGTAQKPGHPWMAPKVKTTLFAFESDLSLDGKNEIERYDEIRGTDFPFVNVICVVGRGYWFWNENKWCFWSPRYPFDEVVGFLSGIHNTYRNIIKHRGTPLLGHYLL